MAVAKQDTSRSGRNFIPTGSAASSPWNLQKSVDLLSSSLWELGLHDVDGPGMSSPHTLQEPGKQDESSPEAEVSSHVPEEDEDEDEEHEYTSVQDTMQVSLVYTEKEADEIRKVIQEEEKRCKRMEDRAKHIMRVFAPSFIATRTRTSLDHIARQFVESFCRVDALASLNWKIQSSKGKVPALSPIVSLADLYLHIRRIKILSPTKSSAQQHSQSSVSNTLKWPQGPIPFIFCQEEYEKVLNSAGTTQVFSDDMNDFSQAKLLCSAGLLAERCFKAELKLGKKFCWSPDTPLDKFNRYKRAAKLSENMKKNSDEKAASIKNLSQVDRTKKIHLGGAYKGDFVTLRQYVDQFLRQGLREVLIPPHPLPFINHFLFNDGSEGNHKLLWNIVGGGKNPLLYPRVLNFLVDPSTPLPKVLRVEPASNEEKLSLWESDDRHYLLQMILHEKFDLADGLLTVGLKHPLYEFMRNIEGNFFAEGGEDNFIQGLRRRLSDTDNVAIFAIADVKFYHIMKSIVSLRGEPRVGPNVACLLYSIYKSKGYAANTLAFWIARQFLGEREESSRRKWENLVAILMDSSSQESEKQFANCLVWVAFYDLTIAADLADKLKACANNAAVTNLKKYFVHLLGLGLPQAIVNASITVQKSGVAAFALRLNVLSDKQTIDTGREIETFKNQPTTVKAQPEGTRSNSSQDETSSAANRDTIISTFEAFSNIPNLHLVPELRHSLSDYLTTVYLPTPTSITDCNHLSEGNPLDWITTGASLKAIRMKMSNIATNDDSIINIDNAINALESNFKDTILTTKHINYTAGRPITGTRAESDNQGGAPNEVPASSGHSLLSVAVVFLRKLLGAYAKDYKQEHDTESKLHGGVEGLCAASVLLAFVLKDYFDREKKICEVIHKIYDIFVEREEKKESYGLYDVPIASSFFRTTQESGNYYADLRIFLLAITNNLDKSDDSGTHLYRDEIFIEPKEILKEYPSLEDYPSLEAKEDTVDSPVDVSKYPHFFDLPLDADAKTIREMDDLILDIEAMFVHELTFSYCTDDRLKAVANCFSRIYQEKSGNDYDNFSQEVHWLPKSDIVHERLFAEAHKYVSESPDASSSKFRASLLKSDVVLLKAVASLASGDTTVKNSFTRTSFALVFGLDKQSESSQA